MKEKNTYDLIKHARTDNEEYWWDFVTRRGVDIPCEGCKGLGTRTYSTTSTWRGGIGGATITTDVCDKCWGSGDKYKHWVNLRKMRK